MLSPCAFLHEPVPETANFYGSGTFSQGIRQSRGPDNQRASTAISFSLREHEELIDPAGLMYKEIKLKGELTEQLDLSSSAMSEEEGQATEIAPLNMAATQDQIIKKLDITEESRSSEANESEPCKRKKNGEISTPTSLELHGSHRQVIDVPAKDGRLLSDPAPLNLPVQQGVDHETSSFLIESVQRRQSKSGDLMKQKKRALMNQSDTFSNPLKDSMNARTTMPTMQSNGSNSKKKEPQQQTISNPEKPSITGFVYSKGMKKSRNNAHGKSGLSWLNKLHSRRQQTGLGMPRNGRLAAPAAAYSTLPQMAPHDLPSMHQIRKIMQNDIKHTEKARQEREKEEAEQRVRQFVQDRSKVPSAVNAMVDRCRENWFKLKGPTQYDSLQAQRTCETAIKKQETNVFYLVASFNHWFPTKMAKYDLDQVSQYTLKEQLTKKIRQSFLRKQSTKILQQNILGGQSSMANALDLGRLAQVKQSSKKKTDVPFDEKYQFSDFVPPGQHFFYFVRVAAPPPPPPAPEPTNEPTVEDLLSDKPKKAPAPVLPPAPPAPPRPPTQHDRHFFCLSDLYEIQEYPGSNLLMNFLHVPENADFELAGLQRKEKKLKAGEKKVAATKVKFEKQ